MTKKQATNNRRVVTAHSRINSAIHHLEFLLESNGKKNLYNDKKVVRLCGHSKWAINSALYDLRNAKTLLTNTTFKNKDKYGVKMK